MKNFLLILGLMNVACGQAQAHEPCDTVETESSEKLYINFSGWRLAGLLSVSSLYVQDNAPASCYLACIQGAGEGLLSLKAVKDIESVTGLAPRSRTEAFVQGVTGATLAALAMISVFPDGKPSYLTASNLCAAFIAYTAAPGMYNLVNTSSVISDAKAQAGARLGILATLLPSHYLLSINRPWSSLGTLMAGALAGVRWANYAGSKKINSKNGIAL